MTDWLVKTVAELTRRMLKVEDCQGVYSSDFYKITPEEIAELSVLAGEVGGTDEDFYKINEQEIAELESLYNQL